jgi:hypothetical protein
VIIRRMTSKWIIGLGIVLMTLSVIVGIASADSPDSTDLKLLNQANQAIEDENWIEAVDHILSYLRRSPDAFEDEVHAEAVLDSLTLTMDHIEKQIDNLEFDLCLETGEAGSCVTFNRDVPQPPSIPLPSTSPSSPTSPSYQLVCRGGGGNSFTYTASSTLSSEPQIWINFEKASFGVGNNWQNVGDLNPGQCSWLDRGIGNNEPNRIVINTPLLIPNRFAISWSQGKVDSVRSQVVNPGSTRPGHLIAPTTAAPLLTELAPEEQTPSNIQQENLMAPSTEAELPTELAPEEQTPLTDPINAVNNLMSSERIQAFDVYNDSEGSFIVTKVGRNSMFEASPSDSATALAAYHPFSGSANDESGQGNHGTVEGARLTEDRHGHANRAYEFDGQDDVIIIPDHSSLDITGQISLAAWVFPTAQKSQQIIRKGVELRGSSAAPYSLSLSGTGDVIFSLNLNSQWTQVKKTGYPLNNWFFVVGTYDGTSMKLYVDGKLESSISVSGSMNTNTSPLLIGTRLNTPADTFKGKIDEIRVYNRALTDAEVQALYGE